MPPEVRATINPSDDFLALIDAERGTLDPATNKYHVTLSAKVTFGARLKNGGRVRFVLAGESPSIQATTLYERLITPEAVQIAGTQAQTYVIQTVVKLLPPPSLPSTPLSPTQSATQLFLEVFEVIAAKQKLSSEERRVARSMFPPITVV